MVYDESGMRIRSRNDYDGLKSCNDTIIWEMIQTLPGDSGSLESAMVNQGGAVTEGFSGGGGGQCWDYFAFNSTQYLYDNGPLLATFDQADSAQELYVNGPGDESRSTCRTKTSTCTTS